MAVDVTTFAAQARTEFAMGMEGAYEKPIPAAYDLFTTTYPSSVKVETHTYMSNLPRLQRFKGYSPGVRLEDNTYTITNFPWRIGPVKINLDDLDDDQGGGYLRQINRLPARGQKDLAHEALSYLAAGTSNLCFDGTALFANSHTWGSGDNLMAGSGDLMDNAGNDGVTHYIIALVTDNSDMKPLILQQREEIKAYDDFDSADAQKRREAEFWGHGRFGFGYGMWWDAIHATVTDTPTVAECYTMIESIINRFRTFTLPKGDNIDTTLYAHEGWEPTAQNFVLLCNLKLGQILKRALSISQYVASTGNVDNVYQNVATVLPTSALGA